MSIKSYPPGQTNYSIVKMLTVKLFIILVDTNKFLTAAVSVGAYTDKSTVN